MLPDVFVRVFVRAVKIKMRSGMSLEDAVNGYVKLTAEQKQQIIDGYNKWQRNFNYNCSVNNNKHETIS